MVTSVIFRKNLKSELEKQFNYLGKVCEGVFIGVFTTKTLSDEYTIVFKAISENSLKITLSANSYGLFDPIFSNLRFLFE